MLLEIRGAEVLRWRLVGAAVWQGLLLCAGLAAWRVITSPEELVLRPLGLMARAFSPSAWGVLLSQVLALAPAFLAQAAGLTAQAPPPAWIPRLSWARGTPAAALLARLLGRAGTAAGALWAASHLAGHALSALLFLGVDARSQAGGGAPPPPALRWLLQYAGYLALAQLLHIVYWEGDVLCFPAVQRHRYFRIKQRLPGAAAAAAWVAVPAAAAAALLAPGRPGAPALLAALASGWACACCWNVGAAVLGVVFTERLRLGDYDRSDLLQGMLDCLAGKQGSLMRHLALHDLSLAAAAPGKAGWRRAEVFGDESGEAWRPLAAACLAEVDAVTGAMAAALPQAQQVPGGSAAAPGGGRSKWNVRPAALARGRVTVGRAVVAAQAAVRGRYQGAALAARSLAGFTSASLKEDRFGVLQQSVPGLGRVLYSLLSALATTQQFIKLLGSLPPRQAGLGPWRQVAEAGPAAGLSWRDPPDAAALALQDVLATCLYSIAGTFGDGLQDVLAGAKPLPGDVGKAEAAALLRAILKGNE